MGGIGSGIRAGKRIYADKRTRINIKRIADQIKQDEGRLRLVEEVTLSDNSSSKKYKVKIVSTSCHYGGHRLWFECPHCQRRVAVLYRERIGFFCRLCADLHYTTQSQGKVDRMKTKLSKIKKRLGVKHDEELFFMSKPKGMHQTTFDKLSLKAERLNEAIERDWMIRTRRYFPHLSCWQD